MVGTGLFPTGAKTLLRSRTGVKRSARERCCGVIGNGSCAVALGPMTGVNEPSSIEGVVEMGFPAL